MVTECQEKRKRGRPSVMVEGEYQMLKSTYHEILTKRGILNKSYEISALCVIQKMQSEGDHETEYLWSPDVRIKWGILRELGKFPEDMIPGLANQVCEMAKTQKRTIRDWGQLLKTFRLHPELFSETVSDNQEV